MYAKIRINGTLEVKTGLHIGAGSAFSAIGAVDSPVIRDVKTNLPMVPGSSLKGKIRTLLAKACNENVTDPDGDTQKILRLFGSAKKGDTHPSRLIFGDMFMENEKELRSQGLQTLTEIKFENGINRLTAVANPRQIERAVRGSCFGMDLVYDIYTGKETEEQILVEADEDIGTLAQGMKLLQYDYLGGNGSRGYGKIKFSDLKLTCVFGSVPEEKLTEWEKTLNEAVQQ